MSIVRDGKLQILVATDDEKKGSNLLMNFVTPIRNIERRKRFLIGDALDADGISLAPVGAAVYAIFNAKNGKVYIGSSKTARSRLRGHLASLRSGKHSNDKLLKSFRKHGQDVWRYLVLAQVEPMHLLELEQACLDGFEAAKDHGGYNLRNRAASNLGFKHKETTKEKLRQARSEQPGHRHSEQTRALKARMYQERPELREALATGLRAFMTEEERASRAEIARARFNTPEVRALRKAAMVGHKVTEETRTKIGDANRGRVRSEEVRAEMSISRRGRIHSPETKAKMAESRRAFWARRRQTPIQESV